MNNPNKNATSPARLSGGKTVQLTGKNEANNITPKPPLKAETALVAFLKLKSMTTFEANAEYGDTCLHTTVSDLYRSYRVEFGRKWETVINRAGRRVHIKRFWPLNADHATTVLADLRSARGVKS